MEYGGDMVVFAPSHQDPSSTILDVLKLLKAFARDPGEKGIAVIQP